MRTPFTGVYKDKFEEYSHTRDDKTMAGSLVGGMG